MTSISAYSFISFINGLNINLSTVQVINPTSRIEKITFSANPSSDRWKNSFSTPSPTVDVTERVEAIQSQLEQEAEQGNLVTGSGGTVGSDILERYGF